MILVYIIGKLCEYLCTHGAINLSCSKLLLVFGHFYAVDSVVEQEYVFVATMVSLSNGAIILSHFCCFTHCVLCS